MHEASIVASLLDMVRQEMAQHGVTRLLSVTVRHGPLAQIVPDAMRFAFEAMTMGTDLDGARLELVEEPLRVACSNCSREFEPDPGSLVCMPCPACGEEFGHTVLTGKDLSLMQIEAE